MITVFVIDADPAVRLTAKRILEAAGFTVIAVADAASALDRLAALRADLVICDIDAAGPTGEAAVNAIGDVDLSAQMLVLFPKPSRYGGHAPLRAERAREAVYSERGADKGAAFAGW